MSKAVSNSATFGNPKPSEESVKLPTGWVEKTIGNIAKTASGGTPSRGRADFYGGEIPWVKSGELGDQVVYETAETLTELGLNSSSAKKFPKGTLCIALYGATVGKLGILGMDAATNQAVCGIFLPDSMDTRYVFRYLESKRRNFIELGKGGAQPNISQEIVRETRIPVPPLPEQQRIVAEIEKQFTRLEAGVAALRRVQTNIKRYRAAVLKAACEGKLVPTEAELTRQKSGTRNLKPGFETGEELLSRILTERRKNWQDSGKYKDPAISTFYHQLIPEGWAVCSIGQVSECLDGRRVPINKANRAKRHGDVPYYGANGQVGWIDDHLFNEPLVLVVEDETFTGRTQAFSYLIRGKSWVNNHAHVLRATQAVLTAYLNYSLAHYPFTARTTGSTGRRKLTQKALMSAPYLLPPLAEQTRIVEEVERRLSVVEDLEALVTANLQRATRLRQSILQKAFTGQLVRQEQPDTSAPVAMLKPVQSQPLNRHFARALLSAEIVHQLHAESTFGRTKHQKIFHLCEHIAQISEIQGQYYREVAGPLDNKLIYANEAELKKQKWYLTVERGEFGHAYTPMPKAGSHHKYLEQFWPDKLPTITRLLKLMRTWDTDRCEIFSTAYAAWNDLILWGQEPTDDAILVEVLERWHESKKRFPPERWLKAIAWMRKEGFVPTGFGKPTCIRECN